MIDIKFLLENPDLVKKAAQSKGHNVDIEALIELIKEQKELMGKVQSLREERNKAAQSKEIERGKEIKQELEKIEPALKEIEENLNKELVLIPNLPKEDVKIGENETENEVIRTWGEPKKFDFTPKDHLELGEALDIIDVKRAAKISGTRFSYLKKEGALLEFALKKLAFDLLIKEGFTPVIPPVLIKKEIMDGLGYTQMGQDEDIFSLDNDGLYLVGTSEQSIVPMFKDEILRKEELPKRFAGFSTCFRREAGSYGKDTKGIFRVHQFDKVEMVSFVTQDDDDKEHEYLLSLEEKFFQMLKIPYQVLKMCTGDLGFPVARKYDLEAWIPSQNKYREVTSTSTTTDFQARRLNIKYQDGGEKKFASILNGTAFSMNRPIIAILENYQQEDGSVEIPEVLREYVGKDVISPHKV